MDCLQISNVNSQENFYMIVTIQFSLLSSLDFCKYASNPRVFFLFNTSIILIGNPHPAMRSFYSCNKVLSGMEQYCVA